MHRLNQQANLPWLQELRDELVGSAATTRDRHLLIALAVAAIAYVVLLFAWLGWWGLLATAIYLTNVVVLGVVVAGSSLSGPGKAAMAIVIPALCVTLLAGIFAALGLV
jgi:hypothetical protein